MEDQVKTTTYREAVMLKSERLSFLLAIKQLQLPTIKLKDVFLESKMSLVSDECAVALRHNQQQIENYPHRQAFDNALREIVRDCQSGNYTKAEVLVDLIDAPHLQVNPEKLGCTDAEVRVWHRNFFIGHIRELLEQCRQGQYEKIDELVKWLIMAENAKEFLPSPITQEDVGTDKEEMERFSRIRSLML